MRKNLKKLQPPSGGVDTGQWAVDFGKRVRILRRDVASLDQRQLAALVGLSSSDTISRLEAGKASQISLHVLRVLVDLARAHGRTEHWLLSGPGFGAPEGELVDRVTAVREWLERIAAPFDGDIRKVLPPQLGMAAPPSWASGAKPPEPATPVHSGRILRTVGPESVPSGPDWWQHYVPIVGRIAAGEGLDAVEAGQYPPASCGEFLVYEGGPRTAIAVRVKGQSMEPEYRDGDFVIVDPSRHVDSGVCCILLDVGGEREPVLKALVRHGRKAVLHSFNPDFPPRTVEAGAVLAAYRIVDHVRRPRGEAGPLGASR